MAVNKNKMCFIPQPVSPLFLCLLFCLFLFQIPDGKVSLTNVFPCIYVLFVALHKILQLCPYYLPNIAHVKMSEKLL